MMTTLYISICLLVVVGAAFVGIRYVLQNPAPETTKEKTLADGQKNVRKHREEFGVSSRGTSMDEAPINNCPLCGFGHQYLMVSHRDD